MQPIQWVIRGPDRALLWSDSRRPAPDFKCPPGSMMKGPGMTDFVPIESNVILQQVA